MGFDIEDLIRNQTKIDDLNGIPKGIIVRDIEDSDLYYEGVTNGDGTYTVSKVHINGFDCITKEEDDMIGEVIEPNWWYIILLKYEKS